MEPGQIPHLEILFFFLTKSVNKGRKEGRKEGRECSLETAQFIKELSRPIDEEKLGIFGHIPEIFAHNDDVDFVNM